MNKREEAEAERRRLLFREEELKKEAYNMKVEEVKNSKQSNQITSYVDYKPTPGEIEVIKLKKQKENCDKVKVQQRVVKTLNDTLKDIPESKDNSVSEILNKVYEIFKKWKIFKNLY